MRFWDPAGFTADGSVEDFKRRRQTELKHGRAIVLRDAVAGGGGTITLPTLFFMGLPPAQVVATNKLLAIFGSASSTVQYWRKGHVDRALVLLIGVLLILLVSVALWLGRRYFPDTAPKKNVC